MEKVKVTQDELYTFLVEHDVKTARIAELMGQTYANMSAYFLHNNDNYGKPRYLRPDHVRKLNEVLPVLAADIRSCLMTYGTDQMYTNRVGRTYDPGMIEPVKQAGRYLNLVSLLRRLLGWSKEKKSAVITNPSSKGYGLITREDINRINAELLAVSGVLSSYEVVSKQTPSRPPRGEE